MGAVLVNHAIAHVSSATTVTTGAVDTTGANFVVALMTFDNTVATVTMTDNKSNGNGTNLTKKTAASPIRGCAQLSYWINPTCGSGHTFTNTGSSGLFGTLAVAAFSGVKVASAFDQQNGFGDPTSGHTTIQPGSITPTENGELIIAGWELDDPTNTTWTVNSGFTITDIQDAIVGATYGGVLAYLVQGTAAAINPTFTRSNADSANRADAAVIASFKTIPQIAREQLIVGQSVTNAATF